jgi:hypothetical protein
MKKQYTIEENGVIWYEENGVRVSFMPDPNNSDYQRYLAWLENPEAEQSTPIPTGLLDN